MKICIAQTESLKGEVNKNIENHLRLIELAIESGADLIIFPELSITGYEPELAKELAAEVGNEIFNPFQELADKNDIVIGIGMPTKARNGINISMLIFQAEKDSLIYSKKLLHADELPYFVSGNNQPFLTIKGKKIGIGICYETLQREHFINALENDAEIYIASVAKPDRGVDRAYLHFPSIAKEFNMPILMSNCIGYCDNFMSNGQSSVWNSKGELIKHLDKENQGLLIYDTALEEVESFQLKGGSELPIRV
jgi:predicted amidohydrolase